MKTVTGLHVGGFLMAKSWRHMIRRRTPFLQQKVPRGKELLALATSLEDADPGFQPSLLTRGRRWKVSSEPPLVARETRCRKRSLTANSRTANRARPGTKAARRIKEQIFKRESNRFLYAAW